jgi:S1-C subfamily serine protease
VRMPAADEPADFGRWVSLLFSTLLTFAFIVGFSGARFAAFGPVWPAPSAGRELPADLIYRASIRGVVKIISCEPRAAAGLQAPSSSGSGFVVDRRGTILTNAHVVTPGGMSVRRVLVIVLDRSGSERRVNGTVMGTDAATDVAVVHVEARGLDLDALPLGKASDLAVGDRVYAIGNPLDYDFSMTAGIVSALHRVVRGPGNAAIGEAIQTDAAVNSGDSGGPLLDAAGRVVGINEQIATEETGGSGNIGLAFAVPIEAGVDVLRQLSRTGRVRHPWLGIEGLTITPELVSLLKLKVETGVLLVAVSPEGPAERAGLRGGSRAVRVSGRTISAGGDIVTAINGRRITGMADVVNLVQAGTPGSIVAVTYARGDAEGSTHVTLGVQPSLP